MKKNEIYNTNLFTQFIANSLKPSIKVQKNYVDVVSKLVTIIKQICNEQNLIFKIEDHGQKFWDKAKKYETCFIDGGVYSSIMSSSAPFAVRAKSYIVRPDQSIKNREKFEETIAYMGDLYDQNNNLYDPADDPYEDNQLINKKKDAARIAFELAAVVRHIHDKQKFQYCFVHGPLQTPIMPFSGPDFPLFKNDAAKNMMPFFSFNKDDSQRHFINIYLESQKFIKSSKLFPVYGVVERTISTIYIRNLIFIAKTKGIVGASDAIKLIDQMRRYKINDGNLFELILKDGEGLKLIEVQKQIPSKAWEGWYDQMNSFPKVYLGYIKTNSNLPPIRIETLNKPEKLEKDYEFILATSRLLPNYGFPVGLDIADKAARIPSWLGQTTKNYYLKYYLNLALQTEEKSQINNALKNISQKGRQWKLRPKAGGAKI